MSRVEEVYDRVEKAFWEATRNAELLIGYCDCCNEPHWHPRPICPHCGHQETSLKRSTGLGRIYSMTRLRSKEAQPQVIAYVQLDEGITMLSKIIDDDGGKAVIGQRVEVAFVSDGNGLHLPVFRLSNR